MSRRWIIKFCKRLVHTTGCNENLNRFSGTRLFINVIAFLQVIMEIYCSLFQIGEYQAYPFHYNQT